MEDHDYTSERRWEKPLLNINQLCILAVLNSTNRCATADSVAHFIRVHFPYYRDTPSNYITKFLKSSQKVLLPRRARSKEIVYTLPGSRVQRCVLKFSSFSQNYKDPTSPVYSMKYPCFWSLMAKGEYNDGMTIERGSAVEQPELESEESSEDAEPEELEGKVWQKPSIPERFLIALAIMNSKTGRLLASEIFAFIEQHFPYYKTADKKWKKQNANEALKEIRGMFGREKLSQPADADKLGNGSLNVYYIRHDRLKMFQDYFVTFEKAHPDPSSYGMENPELWSAMIRGELRENELDVRAKVFSMGKARSQLGKCGKNPYEKPEETTKVEIVRPKLNNRCFAVLAYLQLKQEELFPTEFYHWLQENIFYYRHANPSWKILFKGVLYKVFNKRAADNIENIKANEESTLFSLDPAQKERVLKEILAFEWRNQTVTYQTHGVATQEKWDRIFPKELREQAIGFALPNTSEADKEKEAAQTTLDSDSDDMEDFVDDEDYDWTKGLKGTESDGEKDAVDAVADVVEHKISPGVEVKKEVSPPAETRPEEAAAGNKYGTRRRKIDFNKLISYHDDDYSGSKTGKKSVTKRRKRNSDGAKA